MPIQSVGSNRRNRRLLLTTNTLENANVRRLNRIASAAAQRRRLRARPTARSLRGRSQDRGSEANNIVAGNALPGDHVDHIMIPHGQAMISTATALFMNEDTP